MAQKCFFHLTSDWIYYKTDDLNPRCSCISNEDEEDFPIWTFSFHPRSTFSSTSNEESAWCWFRTTSINLDSNPNESLIYKQLCSISHISYNYRKFVRGRKNLQNFQNCLLSVRLHIKLMCALCVYRMAKNSDDLISTKKNESDIINMK